MRVDTGADVTIISNLMWRKLGQPKLEKARFKLTAANKGNLNCHGYFKCKFEICGEVNEGECYVTDDDITLLGTSWMCKVDKLWKRFSEDSMVATVNVGDLENAKRLLVKELVKKYSIVFEPGLGNARNLKHTWNLKKTRNQSSEKPGQSPITSCRNWNKKSKD